MEHTRNLIANRPAHPVVYLENKQAMIQLFDGQKIVLSLEDFAIMPHMVFSGVWEEYITLAWLQVADKSSVIFDVGSNIGYYSLISAKSKQKDPKTKIVGFEANPYLAEIANKNMAINWKADIAHVENMAIVSSDRTVELTILDDFIGCSSLADEDKLKSYLSDEMDVRVEKKLQVEGVSIDSYCQKNNIEAINLIKLDIEGLEHEAYDGASEVIKNSPDLVMFIEFTHNAYDDARAFYESIKDDFPHFYLIELSGALKDVSELDYGDVINETVTWQMLVVSKKELIHE